MKGISYLPRSGVKINGVNMLETVEHNGILYPDFQAKGNAAQFAIPYAYKVCKGIGVDVGCMKEEWAYPGAFPVDYSFDDEWSASHLPARPTIVNYLGLRSEWSDESEHIGDSPMDLDYIFSSHCLEHVENWVDILDYWTSRLVPNGSLFLYLPDYSQTYWRPWHNRKHRHIFTPKIIEDYLTDTGRYNLRYTSGVDLNNSFMVMARKE